MARGNSLCVRLWLVVVVLVVLVLAGCGAKKALFEAPEEGVVLEYQMPKGQVLKYESSQEFIQNFEMHGRQVEVTAYTTYLFSVESEGMKGNSYQLDFTIDDMKVNVTSSEGDLSGDTRAVVGKSFSMLLSPLGEELKVMGLSGLKYTLGPSGERGISADFEVLFPDLAGKPVKVGDSWTNRDTVHITEAKTNIRLAFQSVNTLEGFETVNGLECARVAAAVTGTLAGTGKEGEVDLTFDGTVEGSDTWHFAYKEGRYVKLLSEASVEGKILAAGPQGMTIPMNNTIKVEMTLVE